MPRVHPRATRARPRRAPPPTTAPAKMPSRKTRSRSAAIASRFETRNFPSSSDGSKISGTKPSSSERRPWTVLARQRLGGVDPDARLGARAGSARRPSACRRCPRPATKTSISGQSARISGRSSPRGPAGWPGCRTGRASRTASSLATRCLASAIAPLEPERAGRVDDLGAEQRRHLAPLLGHVVGHDERDAVALAAADHRQRDAGVAATSARG